MIARTFGGYGWFLIARRATARSSRRLVMRCTRRDSIEGDSVVLYFATPWPVVAGASAVCAALGPTSPGRSVHRGVAACFAGTALSVSWAATTGNGAPGAQGAPPSFASCIGTSTGPLAPGGFAWLAEQDADIIASPNASRRRRDRAARWQTEFPGYRQASAVPVRYCSGARRSSAAEEETRMRRLVT